MKVLKTIGFWFIQSTWGCIMTLIGGFTACVLMIMGYKPKRFYNNIYFEVGENWGAISLGGFFICSKDSYYITKQHEAGHSIQNMLWGPLFPFVIGIPSLLRSQLRNQDSHLKKSLFNLVYFLGAGLATTLLACLGALVLHSKWFTISAEVLRLYFIGLSIWLSAVEIPKYDKQAVDYDSIWFEGQATKWGRKYFK